MLSNTISALKFKKGGKIQYGIDNIYQSPVQQINSRLEVKQPYGFDRNPKKDALTKREQANET